MNRLQHSAFVILCAALLAFLALFPILTIDAVGKFLSRAALLERGNLFLLLYLELSRGLTTVVAIVVSGWLLARASKRADGRALALLLIFGTITFEKILGTSPYPGPLQERLVAILKDAGVSNTALVWAFGVSPWSLWLALAALLRFSVVFTHPPLNAAMIEDSGVRDRRGMMRGTGVAGADVGQTLRSLARRALELGLWRPLPVWAGAGIMVFLTTVMTGGAATLLMAAGAALILAVALVNLRAAYGVAAEAEKRRMRWLLLAVVLAGAIVLAASLPLLFFDDPVAQTPALVLLMLAPVAAVICLGMAVMYRGGMDARHLLRRLPGDAALALAVLLVFALATTGLAELAEIARLPRVLAVIAGLAITAALLPILRRWATWAVDYILERSSSQILS